MTFVADSDQKCCPIYLSTILFDVSISMAMPSSSTRIRRHCSHGVIWRSRQIRVCRFPPDRRASASLRILGALDDKIDLNRRMNETLEAMARAIFKDWFVDFGPTRAKMEGRAPYLAPEIWALFPDRLDDEGNPDGVEDWHACRIMQASDRLVTGKLSGAHPIRRSLWREVGHRSESIRATRLRPCAKPSAK